MKVSVSVCLSVLMVSVHQSRCNQWDPHVFPTDGPYYEGWYLRVTDFSQGASLAWMFGHILPEDSTQNSASHTTCQNHSTTDIYYSSNSMRGSSPCPVMTTHLVSAGPTSKLLESHSLLPGYSFALTKNGHAIHSNPDDQSPAEFEAKMGEYINFIVKPNGTTFSITVGDSTFKGETASPVPWGPHGERPEGWLEYLPLSMHWFVYSLRSDVKHYEYTNHKTGQVITGGSEHGKPVVAYMEKNWGSGFPKGWIWAQGVNPTNNVSFACLSSLTPGVLFDTKAQLSGYKNPSKNIDCKFHPLVSVHVLEHDGCKGFAKLKVEGLNCAVLFDITSDPSLLSSCMLAPQATGYGLGCVESFNAVGNITVFQRHGWKMVQTDSQIIEMAAVEFGGTFMCNGQCP